MKQRIWDWSTLHYANHFEGSEQFYSFLNSSKVNRALWTVSCKQTSPLEACLDRNKRIFGSMFIQE